MTVGAAPAREVRLTSVETWGFKALYGLVVAIVVFVSLFLVAKPGRIWLHLFREFNAFHAGLLAHLLVLVGFSFVAAGRLRPLAYNLLFAALLSSMYSSTASVPLGNPDGQVEMGRGMRIMAPELLSHLMDHLLYRWVDFGYLPVVWGFLAAFMYLQTCDELFEPYASKANRKTTALPGANKANRKTKTLCTLLYLGTGVHLLFFREHREHTACSIPFMLAFVLFGARYLRSQAAPFDANVLWSSLALGAAGALHGSNAFLAPALPAMIGIRRLLGRQYRLLAIDLALSFGLIAALLGLIVLGLTAAGFQIEEGSMGGGGDNTRFVPMCPMDSPYFYFTMFSARHMAQIANIVLLVFPAGLVALLAGARKCLQARQIDRPSHALFLAILGLGHLGFISLWGFDLGFPADTYLMLGISLALQLFLVMAVLSFCGKYVAATIVCVNLSVTWASLSILLTDVSSALVRLPSIQR